jgi:hypothetical protein
MLGMVLRALVEAGVVVCRAASCVAEERSRLKSSIAAQPNTKPGATRRAGG